MFLLVIQAFVATFYAVHSYFVGDDFTYFYVARHSKLDYSFAIRSANGHLVPGYMLNQKLYTSLFGTNYAPAVVIMVTIALAGTVAMYRLVRALVGRGYVPILVAAMFGCLPFTLNSVIWWSISTTVYASLVATVAVIGSYLRWRTTRRYRHLVSMAAMFVLGLAFWEKSELVALYLVLLAVLVLDAGLGWRTRLRSLLADWPAWLILASLAGIDLIIYANGPYLQGAGIAPPMSEILHFLALSFSEGLAPGLFGFHLPDVLMFGSSNLTTVLTSGVILAYAVWTSVRSSVARNAWIFFVVCYLVNQGVLARARIESYGIHIGRDLRYQYDDLLLFCIALAVSTSALPRWGALGARAKSVAIALGVGLVGLMSFATSQTMSGLTVQFPGDASRLYFDNFRRSWSALLQRDPSARLLDLTVAPWIVLPPFYPYNRYTYVLSQVRNDVRFGTSGPVEVLSADGTVVAATFAPHSSATIGACGSSAPSPATTTFAMPPSSGINQVVMVKYRSTVTQFVHVRVGSGAAMYPTSSESDSYTAYPGSGEFLAPSPARRIDSVTVGVDVPSGICIAAVEVGTMVAIHST